MSNAKNSKFQTIFSLRIKVGLSKEGIEPVLEKDNKLVPGFKCWMYEVTPEFVECVNKLMGGK